MNAEPKATMNEFDRIARFLRPLAQHEGALGLTDDAAVLPQPDGSSLVLTKDAMVEGVHFIGNESPASLAQKLLAVNLSDLAAMGATPYGYLLATMLPQEAPAAWLEEFCQGLDAMQQRYHLSLLGGDSTRSMGGISLSLTALGTLPAGVSPLLRSGAKVGDVVVVSGTIGDAAFGLRILQQKTKSNDVAAQEYFVSRYHTPTPRIALGQALRGVASACMDISDGLLQDAAHIAKASQVDIVLEATQIPLHAYAGHLALSDAEVRELAMTGGDDYELLFTLPEVHVSLLEKIAHQTGIVLQVVGRVVEGAGHVQLQGASMPTVRGFNHFA